MKKIKNTLQKIALILCFFSCTSIVIGQERGVKGINCQNDVQWSILKDQNFDCRFNVKFTSSYLPQNLYSTKATALPHGIYIHVDGGSISGIGSLFSSINWFTTLPIPTRVPSSIPTNLHDIFWIKQISCGNGGVDPYELHTKVNIIKPNETLIFPIDVIPDPGASAIKIYAYMIYGSAWPACLPATLNPILCNACVPPAYSVPSWPTSPPYNSLDCPDSLIYHHDTTNYQIQCNYGESYPNLNDPIPGCVLCLPDHNTATLTLNPQPLPITPVTTVVWFECTTCPFPCSQVNLSDLPVPYGTSNSSPWMMVLDQTYPTGTYGLEPFYPTIQLSSTTCYVAMITRGCDSWLTDPLTLWVCDPLPGINISANPAFTMIGGEHHACYSWNGTLTLNVSPNDITCPTDVIWEQYDFRTPTPHWDILQNSPMPPNNTVPNPLEYTVLSPLICNPNTIDCDSLYSFKVTLDNDCPGISQGPFDIYIDKRTEDCPYTFTAEPPVLPTNWIGNVPGTTIQNPIFCDSGATVIRFDSRCLSIWQWEYSKLLDPCQSSTAFGPWTVLSQAGTSLAYWTNTIDTTTRYRVWIYNRSCLDLSNPVYSSELEVTIIPDQTLSLTTDYEYICPGCPLPTLTATVVCPAYNTITGNTITGYEWYLNGSYVATTQLNTFQVNTPGDWTVAGIGGLCGPAPSNRVIICGEPGISIEGPLCCIPPGILIGGPWCFCDGESITLTATAGGCNVQTVTYEWRDPNGQPFSTNASVNITVPGTYTVTAICDNCCVITATGTTIQCPSSSP
jgi:hypothetical protein